MAEKKVGISRNVRAPVKGVVGMPGRRGSQSDDDGRPPWAGGGGICVSSSNSRGQRRDVRTGGGKTRGR